MEALAEVVVK